MRACVRACVCVCSDSRNDVPRVAQRYGTIAAHTRRRSSVVVVFVVFCVHMYRYAGFDKADATATFSDTAITDRHSNTTIFLAADILVCWIGKIVQTCAKKPKLGSKGHANNNRVRRKQWRDIKKPAKYRELWVPHRTKKRVCHNYSYITSSLAFQKS